MNGLDPSQRQALQQRIGNMNQFREQMNVQTRLMDQELASPNADAQRVAERAQEMERVMNNWRKEYKALFSEVE
jgi:alcohol dehydrogenase YqhD (iron-dependent ADH family)